MRKAQDQQVVVQVAELRSALHGEMPSNANIGHFVAGKACQQGMRPKLAAEFMTSQLRTGAMTDAMANANQSQHPLVATARVRPREDSCDAGEEPTERPKTIDDYAARVFGVCKQQSSPPACAAVAAKLSFSPSVSSHP